MVILAILFAVLGFLIFPSNVYAEFTFAVPQTIVTADQDIETSVVLSLQGQNNKIYYIEGAFKKESSSSYFGLTWNDSSWVKYTASNFTTLKQVTTDQAGKWNGIVKVKLDKDSSLFSGNGVYTLRLKRFTTGGSDYWAENSINITVNSSTASPVSTPPPTPIPSTSSTTQTTSSFTISNIPSQINSDQSFNVSVNLTLTNNRNTDYYLSSAFKKADGTRYFGLTKINSNWVKYESSNYFNQYKITTDDSGNWTGTLEVKPDTSDTDYKGSGDYIFKVGRYTSSGSGPTWSNESTIKIISTESDQDATSINTSSLKSTTSISPSSVKTTSASNKSSRAKNYDTLVYHNASVAAVTTSANSSTSSAEVEVKNQKQTNPIVWIGLIFIFAGAATLGYIYLKKNAKIHIPFSK